jgi:hypothetical protein
MNLNMKMWKLRTSMLHRFDKDATDGVIEETIVHVNSEAAQSGSGPRPWGKVW